jgi:predicted enzyme related to lactoylglutathione lyase
LFIKTERFIAWSQRIAWPADRVVAQGGTIVMPPTEIPGVVTLAMFADPDGTIIGLTKGQP